MGTVPAGTSYELDVEGIRVLVTHKRVKNVNMRIGTDGVARMSVPVHFSRERARQVALSHATWFREHSEVVQRRMADQPTRWETGDTVWVWGKAHLLRVEEAESGFGCECTDAAFVLRVPKGTSPEGRQGQIERWYANELRTRVLELLPECQERVGRAATSITLRRMKTRWGSCTARTGRIRLNVALAECPPECVQMVLIHELCHMIEPNHGARFHALMDLHCPNWRATQRWLNEHPPRA